ncbi:ATP-binding cassette domain-containing protein [Paenibacillus sp.]|uniref:ATP-binding cassette domain-containing protein n=1 Tax=Paenibacillus sp. TaxID=58172 RepID=UPI002D39DCDE|nr:ATP-binding cassette domain-containing protein [Paenibacillus sp.]HZG85908.1 ATP-binding cassette domain-containing protein [Paenibacillus sp.]
METIFIRLQNATVRYIGAPLERPAALDGVTLDVVRGSWIAVVGRNGGGKSTLSKAIAGIAPLSEGIRTVEGGGSVHMVLQHPETQLLGETVEEELSLCAPSDRFASDPEQLRAQWRGLLRELGLAVSLDTPVKRLSGGQKQLLNIAGCIAAGADCVVFDESTAMLDPASRQTVLDAAAALHRAGRTIVWSTHRMEEVVRAGRVIAMERGRIAFNGTPERFFYGEDGGAAPCDALGFEPPYIVRAARALMERGYPLGVARPLLPESLAEAVAACRS